MVRRMKFIVGICLVIAMAVLFVSGNVVRPDIEKSQVVDRYPILKPDYTDITIPPNIAAMNFCIQEEGKEYYAKIYGENGNAIEVFSKSADVILPQKDWHKLLDSNRGKKLYIDIYARDSSDEWKKFKTITNSIAQEDIDSYVTYRNIEPVHGTWNKMAIEQRDLRSFKTKTIINNNYFVKGCVNCHTFNNNNTEKMTLAVRSNIYGSSTLLIDEGQIHNLGVKFTYSTWHKSGTVIAFSINKVAQFFNFSEEEVRNVVDLDSMLAYYNLKTRKVKTIPAFMQKDMLETYPAFSGDGKYLYYSVAKKYWKDDDKLPPNRYEDVKYSLMRISYDIASDSWGEPEVIIDASKTQKSAVEARISPDGRWLLFCMCDYGCFPVYQPSSDLYLIDLAEADKTGSFEYKRISANSDKSESWHSFSSNSKWIAFSSKSLRSRLTVTQFCYVNDKGQTSKPFIMPQEKPGFYDSFTMTFSVPEFTQEPVKLYREKLGRIIRSGNKTHIDLPITMATPGKSSAWKQRE